MKLLIIGADGFIGKRLLHAASKVGWEVSGTSRKGGTYHFSFDLASDSLTTCMSSKLLSSFDAAVICAAIPKIDRCYLEKDYCERVNVTGTKQIIQELMAVGVKPVFLSSDQVFDGEQGYYSEVDVPAPLNEYGRQKAEVEKHILSFGVNALVLRLSLVVSDNIISDPHVFYEWYQKFKKNETVFCIKDQVLSPTLVDDVTKGIIKSLECNLSGLYNLANSEFFSRYELACQFFRALELQAKIKEVDQEFFNFPERRPIKHYIDSARFRRETGMAFTSMSTVFQRIRNG